MARVAAGSANAPMKEIGLLTNRSSNEGQKA
jgi:hypothetical protein